jgi:hypothetical protein
MMAVRRNLTEILLEVTNEEILDIAKETCVKIRKKGSQTMNYLLSFNRKNQKKKTKLLFYLEIKGQEHKIYI